MQKNSVVWILFGVSGADHSAGLGLAHADVVQQRTVGGADEGAGAAFDAVHYAVLLAVLPALQLGEGAQQGGFQSHRAAVDAFAATDAGTFLAALALLLAHKEETGHTLGYIGVEVGDGLAHHRAAGDDLAGILGDAH